ncbi:hypothetical protein GYB22_00085 [bacterium]|nr:hypothetical protein [bacterium]
MSKNTKVILGILSFLPIVAGVAMFIFFFQFFIALIQESGSGQVSPDFIEDELGSIMMFSFLVIVTSIASLGLMVTFIIFSIKDRSASENQQLLWALLLFFMGPIVFPIYWYIRIWDNPDFGFEKRFTDRID